MSDDKHDDRAITLDFLYLDLSACGRCQGADEAVERAMAAAQPALEALGAAIALRRIHVTSLDQARAEGFTLSPTIRVNGADIQPGAPRSRCRECGDLCDCADGVDCREWLWRGAQSLTPPVAMIVHHVLAAATEATGPTAAAAPEAQPVSTGVERFFAGAPTEKLSCCPPDCCG